MKIKILDSARKHGLSDDDIIHALIHADDFRPLKEEPNKFIYLGYDTAMRQLEVITVEKVEDLVIVIHAMKARKSVIKWFKEKTHE